VWEDAAAWAHAAGHEFGEEMLPDQCVHILRLQRGHVCATVTVTISKSVQYISTSRMILRRANVFS
jgi:hypothetical protein